MPSPDPPSAACDAVVVGGGPAGLMAAERLARGGCAVVLTDRMPSVGRKFLLAGKGGLNLTHAEPLPAFAARYAERSAEAARWLDGFEPTALREWAAALGIDTFVGSSGRVFPRDLKAAPLLRAWLQRLRQAGVDFRMRWHWRGWTQDGCLRFETPDGERCLAARATVLACGGASWPQLGADGAWVPWLEAAGAGVAALQPSNCGFDVAGGWSGHLRERFAGAPIKPVRLCFEDGAGPAFDRRGEFVLSDYGVEGSLVYAASARLRDAVSAHGQAVPTLDLLPDVDATKVHAAVAAERGRRSFSTHLQRRLALSPVKTALLHEVLPGAAATDAGRVAGLLKALPLTLVAPRPLAEAISTAGGVRLESLDAGLMLRRRPGVFCCGEMLDWEAPTGGYLLQACFSSGRLAGDGAAACAARRAQAG